MPQEVREWLGERFGRLELILGQAVHVTGSALTLMERELEAVRAAREELGI